MAISVGPGGEMRLVLRVQDDGTAVIEKFSDDAEKKLGDSSKKVADNTKKDLGVAGAAWEKHGKTIEFAVAGAVVAAGVFLKMTLDAADNMLALSERTGISVERLSAWKFIADQSNTSLEQLIPGLRGLALNMDAAQDKTSEQAKAFARLGVSVTDSNGNLRDLDAVMLEVADRFSRMKDGAAKTTLAQDIFTKGGMAMITVMNQGSAGISQLTAEAKKLGVIFTTEGARAADEFNDSINKVKASLAGLAVQIVNTSAKAISQIAEEMAKAATNAGLFSAAIRGIGEAWEIWLGGTGSDALQQQRVLVRSIQQEIEMLEKAIEMRKKSASVIGPDLAEMTRKLDAAILTRRSALAVLERLEEQENKPVEKKKKDFTPPATINEEEAKAAAEREAALIKQRAQSREEIAAVTYQRWQDQMKAHLAVVEALRKEEFDGAVSMGAELRSLFEADLDHKAALAARKADIDLALRDRLYENLFNERETLRAHYEEEFDALNDLNARKVISNEEYYALMGRLVQKNIEDQTTLEDAEIKKRYNISKVYHKLDLESSADFFGRMAVLMQTKSKKMFEIGKAAAIAEAIINMYSGAVGAYKTFAGIPIVGHALGIAAAAASIAMNTARIQAIRSTQFGTQAATPVFSASPSTGLPESPLASSRPAEQPDTRGVPAQHREVNLYVRGWLPEELVREELVPALNDAIGDGVIINVRQGA